MPPPQIADVLATNLEAVFDGLCVHRYGGALSLERADSDPALPTVRFCLCGAGLPALHVDFEIRHVGGNVYDVHGTIENGPSRSFTYSLPDPVPLSYAFRAPRLAETVSIFLLDALERRVGSDQLKREIRDRRPPRSSSERSTSRPPFRFRP